MEESSSDSAEESWEEGEVRPVREGPRRTRDGLYIRMMIEGEGVEPVPAVGLVDTGAEVCLVRKGLLSPSLFQPATKGLRLVAANGAQLGGGTTTAKVQVVVQGVRERDQQEVEITIPLEVYEAGVGPDVILSYPWLVGMGLNVFCKEGGLRTHLQPTLFLPGEAVEKGKRSWMGVRAVGAHEVPPPIAPTLPGGEGGVPPPPLKVGKGKYPKEVWVNEDFWDLQTHDSWEELYKSQEGLRKERKVQRMLNKVWAWGLDPLLDCEGDHTLERRISGW